MPEGLTKRARPHGHIFILMAMIVGHMAALVGSLYGDYVGSDLLRGDMSWREYYDWRQSALFHISWSFFAIVWALVLLALTAWSALKGLRFVFNVSVTFLVIHLYTQAFESFNDAPLAFAVGGLLAIPIAWGLWRANQALDRRNTPIAASL